jgi:phosphomevalonate kinase
MLTVSTPGKVLLTGGYLVLENPNVGITLTGSSRFFVSINQAIVERDSNILSIQVISNQFAESYKYHYISQNNSIIVADAENNNVFVAKCLQIVFSFLTGHYREDFQLKLNSIMDKGKELEIFLYADNDFYSQMHQVMY